MVFLALFTRFLDRTMRTDTVATGCISLSGRVMMVSNVNTKIRAAKRHGYKRIVIPHSNYAKVEEALLQDPEIEILHVVTVLDLLNHCLIDEHSELLG